MLDWKFTEPVALVPGDMRIGCFFPQVKPGRMYMAARSEASGTSKGALPGTVL
jgi:hypothetical protein